MNSKTIEEVQKENQLLMKEIFELKNMIGDLQKEVRSVKWNTRPKTEYSSWEDFPY